MAEIEFFATWEEIGDLAQWLLDRQCEFIPDLHYESSSFDRIADLTKLRSLAKSTPGFYIVRDDLIESPLKLREVSTAEKHFFYIDARTGGPTLDLYWGRQFAEDERPHLSATELSYYSWYLNSVTGAREDILHSQAQSDLWKGIFAYWLKPTAETAAIPPSLPMAANGFETLNAVLQRARSTDTALGSLYFRVLPSPPGTWVVRVVLEGAEVFGLFRDRISTRIAAVIEGAQM